MYGQAFGDVAYADAPDVLVQGSVSITITLSIGLIPQTEFDAVLTDQRNPLVFSAEIHPWVLSERS